MTSTVFDATAARSAATAFPAHFLRLADNARASAERPCDLARVLAFLFGPKLDDNTRVDITIPL